MKKMGIRAVKINLPDSSESSGQIIRSDLCHTFEFFVHFGLSDFQLEIDDNVDSKMVSIMASEFFVQKIQTKMASFFSFSFIGNFYLSLWLQQHF